MVAAALIFLILAGGREETEVIVEIIIPGRRRGAEAKLGALEQRRILKVEAMDILAAVFAGEVGLTTGRVREWPEGGGVEVRDVDVE